MSWPEQLKLNAWYGNAPVAGALARRAVGWSLTEPITGRPIVLRPPATADDAKWRDVRVGWGLIVAEGAQVPDALQCLVANRGNAPVFTYRASSAMRFSHLWDAQGMPVSTTGTVTGVAAGVLPKYLLIYGSPADIPWELQYILNTVRLVGRIDLTGDALARYVDCLIGEWLQTTAHLQSAIVWSTASNNPDEITRLMRDAIGKPVADKLASDAQLSAHFIDGVDASATAANLTSALVDERPALVVTTSHGNSGPFSNAAPADRLLGVPVDQDGALLDPQALVTAWQPDGAIWYAHACCSAGRGVASIYDGVFEAGSDAARFLSDIGSSGALIGALPRALLSAPKPARAFVGHVEPTFDWTLRQPGAAQHLTARIVDAVYDRLYQPYPLGFAFEQVFAPIAALETIQREARKSFDQGQDSRSLALYALLASRDIQSTVVIGDPTVAFPPLP